MDSFIIGFIALFLGFLLAGAAHEQYPTNFETINHATELCTPNNGLSSIEHISKLRTKATCTNGAEFTFSNPSPKKE